ncbi:MAG: RNA polymerase factor sigma-54 [Deltaproteobacteria bacterium]|nr:RNA polymerase factor sigma-54 [Deltaproteobacteria bacterium]
MAMELKQTLKLTQQLVMTPQLQQAIKLLQLSRQELVEEINQELEENPVLVDQTQSGDDSEGGETEQESERAQQERPVKTEEFAEVKVETDLNRDFDWENYLGEYSSSPANSQMYESQDETPSYENFVSAKTSLAEHLLWQWRMSNVPKEEQNVGIQIIGNLDQDGYLKSSLEEIAVLEGTTTKVVERTLARVQELDPVGVAARDLKECLLIQLRFLNLGESLAAKIIENCLSDLESKNYPNIARQLKVPKEAVYEAEKVILFLEPRPGRQFTTEESQYISPDVYVYKIGQEYVIVLNEDGLPKLKISQHYRDMLTDGFSNNQAKDYLQTKLRGAMWLIRSIHQRQRTIYRVTESIFKFQRAFLEKGVEYLKPLVLRDVAEDVGLHESTVSRVTTNKYVHTPQGLFELKFFFDSPINRFQGESLASESVKKRLKQIVSAEDPRRPLSDQRIVEIMRGANIDIARRTVAKYREMLGIAPSSKRKKHY